MQFSCRNWIGDSNDTSTICHSCLYGSYLFSQFSFVTLAGSKQADKEKEEPPSKSSSSAGEDAAEKLRKAGLKVYTFNFGLVSLGIGIELLQEM